MKRIRTGHKIERGRKICPCMGTGQERTHCHLCKNKDLSTEFKEIGGHLYCPPCLNGSTRKD
jgi:late competence protein required for DNA uptake (superfamily II DNA/RNA helicase)